MFKSLFFILLSFLFIQFSFGNDTHKNYKIGVLSLTTKEKTIKKWEATANYLSTNIKNSTFSIIPMTYDEINLAMKKTEIDFLLTNPAHYITHEKELSLFRLATVIYSKKDYDISSFGGVIVALKENNKINTILDIVNKKIAAVKKGSLGGYQSQIKEILDNNLPLPNKSNVIFTDMPHRNTLDLLLNKKVDVAFLRSSVIENLNEKNEIDINKFKIINQKHKEYPFYVSTKLYPEWPFSALSHIDNELKKTVAETLFNIEQTNSAAVEGKYKGWYIPLDYNVVTELLKELRLPPFDKISNFTIKDIIEKYIEFFIIFIILTILVILYLAKEKKQYEIIYKDNKSLLEVVAIENDLKTVLNKIVYLSEKRNSKTMCSILLLDDDKKHLHNGSAPSLPDFYNDAIDGVEIGEKIGSCGSAAFTKQRVIVENINTHENWQPFLELTQRANLHSCWSQPIISSKNEILGTFAIYNKVPKKPCKFELKLIESYANIASKAIEKFNTIKILHDNERKSNQLFNNSQSGLLYIDENRKLIRANQRFADILGYENANDMIGFTMEEFHLSKERFVEFGKKFYSTLISTNENFNIEYELKRKDGSSIWCELAGKELYERTPADLSKGVLWTVHDISLRKKYEFELEEKQLLLKNILTALPDMIWLKDIQGTYLVCNPEFERFFGAKESEIIGKTDYDFVDKELADSFREHDFKALNSNIVLINEEWITYADNSKKVLLDTSKTAIRNSKNEIIGILGIGHDVTIKEEKNKELYRNKKKLDDVLEASGEGMWDWNIKTNHVEHNSKWYEILGLNINEDTLTDFTKLIHEEDRDRVLKKIDDVLSLISSAYQSEHRLVKKDGSIVWVIDKGRIVEYDEEGNPLRLAGSFSDITDRKHIEFELEEQNKKLINSEKMASMGEMIGNIAHQWRQPLSVISTGVTGMQVQKEMDCLTDKVFSNTCKIVNENVQYLSQTIEDFKNYLKGSHKKDNFNVHKNIDSFLSLVQGSIKSDNIKIIFKNESTCNISINGYENELIQCYLNIFKNSRDAFRGKSIDKKYFTIKIIQDKNKIKIKLFDNAGGISDEILPKIYEPYFTTKHKSQGTGLGLYMTYNLITDSMNGSIEANNIIYKIEDKEYQGAQFIITLPIS